MFLNEYEDISFQKENLRGYLTSEYAWLTGLVLWFSPSEGLSS